MPGLNVSRATLRRACVLLLVSTYHVGCTSYIARGKDLYYQGRYIESEEVLARHERDLQHENASRQAEYATYRGLSMLFIGDLPRAYRWMSYAYSIEQANPGALRPQHRKELDRGWNALMARLHGAAPPPAPLPPGWSP
jgi:hypothetical protein